MVCPQLIWLVSLSKKKEISGRHTQRKDHVGTQQDGRHLQAKERGLRKTQICWRVDLDLVASRTVRKSIYVGYATQFMVFCYVSPRKPIQRLREVRYHIEGFSCFVGHKYIVMWHNCIEHALRLKLPAWMWTPLSSSLGLGHQEIMHCLGLAGLV